MPSASQTVALLCVVVVVAVCVEQLGIVPVNVVLDIRHAAVGHFYCVSVKMLL